MANVVMAALRGNTLEGPARAKQVTGKSKTRRTQEAFARHLRHVGQMCPQGRRERVVLIIDKAPWDRGKPIDVAFASNPHLEFRRLPSDRQQLDAIEHIWKLLLRRATHNRFFESLSSLKRSIRASRCYSRTVEGRLLGMVAGCYVRPKI